MIAIAELIVNNISKGVFKLILRSKLTKTIFTKSALIKGVSPHLLIIRSLSKSH